MNLDELLSPDYKPKRQPPTPTRTGQSLGGLRAAAGMSPEERSARARKAALAGIEKRDAEREAAGLPPRKKRPPEPSAEELEPFYELLDAKYPKRQWASREVRRREAILLMRIMIAENAAKAFKNSGDA